MRLLSNPLSAIVLACMVWVTGCESAPATLPQTDLGPQLDAAGQHRSLALDTPLQYHLQARRAYTGVLPWYADRNDHSPAAHAGYIQPTVQRSITITRDRQHTSHGRAHDHYSSTTYRREYRQSVR